MRGLLPAAQAVDLEQAYVLPAGRPWLRAMMVCTLDGAVRSPAGLSAGISGPGDRAVFAMGRRTADVVLVGAGTARAEGYGPAKVPIALVTARLDLDLGAALFVEAEHRTILLTVAAVGPARLEAAAEVADVVVCGQAEVDLRLAVAALRERGLHRVVCEGGPALLAAVCAAGLLDELCLTLSPLLAGAGDAGGRLLGMPALPGPLSLRLGQVLEEDGFLFTRYLAVRA
jgi:riboflavin biosynthesis pyrimidine reductase